MKMKRKILAGLMAMMMSVSALPQKAALAAAESDYYPYAPTANSYLAAGGAVALTWRNPVAEISDVVLYSVAEDGTKTAVDSELSTTSDTGVTKIIEGLDASAIHHYKVEFTFADGHDETSLMLSTDAAAYTANTSTGVQLGGSSWARKWSVLVPDQHKASDISIVTDEKYAGTASLHISNNWEESGSMLIFYRGSSMGGADTFKGYYKANKYKPGTVLGQFPEVYSNGSITGAYNETTTDGWQSFSYSITENSGTDHYTKLWIGKYPAKDLWIDNLSILSGTTEYIQGAKWIGDFETYTAASTAAATAVLSGATANVEITAPESSQNIYIYETVDGTDVIRAVLDPSQTEVELENIGESIKIASKDTKYVMSEKTDVTVIKESNYYASAPTFATGAADGTAVKLTWRNPVTAPSKVSLYDITDAENVTLIANNLPTDADTAVETSVEGLAVDTEKVYKVVFDFADHASTSMILSGYTEVFSSGDKNKISGSDWTVFIDSPGTNFNVADGMSVDTTVGYGGSNASLHISNNHTSGVGYALLKFYDDAANPLIKVGEKWTLSLKLKAVEYDQKDAANVMQPYNTAYYAYIKNGSTSFPDLGYKAETFDWITVSKTITVTQGDVDWPYIFIRIPRMLAKDMWIDDITFCKQNEDGTYGENVIEGGDFENTTAARDVTEAKVTAVGDGTASISYSIPSGTKEVLVYEKLGNELVIRATAQDLDSLTIDGLTNDVENELVIKTLGNEYTLSNGVTLTATPKSPEYQTGDYELYSGVTETSTVAAGDMTVKLYVKNNRVSTGFVPCYIVALYNGNTLVDFDIVDDVTIAVDAEHTYEGTVTVPTITDGDDYKIKAFLWEDLENMGILKDYGEF
ncbi:MAG: hypothetical protein J6C82_03370 [Clostridia bacterium]|nr:hypothetical protein [Clostridia bacterium]MBP3360085.1 hypothetical protein [Clostridia bacterium]